MFPGIKYAAQRLKGNRWWQGKLIIRHGLDNPTPLYSTPVWMCVTCSVMLSMRYRSGWTMRMICCSGWLFNSHMENTRSSRRVLVPVRRAFWRTKTRNIWSISNVYRRKNNNLWHFKNLCLALFALRNRLDPFSGFWITWLVSDVLVVQVHAVPPPVWEEQVHIEGRDAGWQGRSGRQAGCLIR